jgi:cation diffusion facilitator CzcD-associated flavoprotein CzcO
MHSTGTLRHEVIIIGAGFGGMGVAIQLQRLGIHDFHIVDRASDLGGTWHINSYPGLAVDIASPTYSYSFEPNPYWSRLYAPGAELKKYANHVADKYRLRPHMQFNANVEKVVYDEGSGTWTVHIPDSPALTARMLILATGFLSQPKRPDIQGLEDFGGKVIHTAEWDHDYDLTGKRAAVIGTGATAVQLLPEIAPKLAQMDVYQRTPIWVSPKFDPKIAPAVQRIFATFPATQRAARAAGSSILELAMVSAALHHRELPFLSQGAEQFCLQHLHRQIPDRELRQKLTPKYSFGCKRPTFSNEYYPTFLRPNVELVTDGIDHIEADGIVTVDGKKRSIDTLILATGYKVWEKGNFPAFEVYGRGGAELGDGWNRNGYESYEGITVHGYPNLFYLASPYSFTGLSYFFTIEGQMEHIARCLKEMRRRKARRFEVKRRAQEAFVAKMRERVKSSVFENGNCLPANSYYFNQHGESTLLRPTPTPVALWRAKTYPLRDYRFE